MSESIDGVYVSSCLKALESYHAAGPVNQSIRGFMSAETNIEAPAKAAIIGEAILSFSGNLGKENRTDAQNAFFHATLIATRDHPGEDQGQAWYRKFCDVMSNTGWMPISTFYSDMEIGGTSVRMDKLVLEILGSAITAAALPGPTSALMLKVASDAVTALKKRDTALTLYENNLLDQGVGGMAAGVCSEVDGEAKMSIGVVRFKRRNRSDKVLFVDVDVRNVKIYRGETVFSKNDVVARATRSKVEEYITANALNKIAEYQI